jgi:acyl-CoA dehydrogenase
VEGANILTRSMIIFGQGAIRGHPWVLKEIEAARETDPSAAAAALDRALFGHIGFVIGNTCRALWFGLTNARLIIVPGDDHTRRYYQQLTRMSTGFAFLADMCLFLLGAALKRRELLSARLGDILSQMYLISAALKRYEDAGRPRDDLPMLDWGVRDAFYRIQEAFFAVFGNLPKPSAAVLLRLVVFPLGRLFRVPPDDIGRGVARTLSAPGPARDRLTHGVYISKDERDAVGALEVALRAVIAAEPIEAKLQAASKAGTIAFKRFRDEQIEDALRAGIIDAPEANALQRADALRRKVIMVDDFPKDLGPSEIHQTTEAVTFEPLRRALRRAREGVSPHE